MVVTVVVIIIAVIMITAGSAFTAKLLGLFYPNGDKSTLKSFNTIFSVLSAKSVSTQDYDATTLNIYLRNKYQILIFEDKELYSVSNAKVYAPSICERGKMCLCLYKDKPAVGGEKDKETSDENLVKCNVIEKKLDMDSKWADINGVVSLTAKPYKSYIFIKYVNYSGSTPKSYLYVLEDNATNQEISKELSVPVCKTKNQNDLCFGKKNGESVEANDTTSLSKIYAFCQNKEVPKYKALGVMCEYPPVETDCQPECDYHETRDFCDKYSNCESFNRLKRDITSSITIKYMTDEDTENFQQYSLCVQDVNFCDVNDATGCSADTLKVYACKESNTGAADDPNLNDNKDEINENCLPPSNITIPELGEANCGVNFLKYSGNKVQIYERNLQTSFITLYDMNNEKCKAHMNTYFYDGVNLMVCKQGKDAECQDFIDGKDRWIRKGYDCELKVIPEGSSYWLTHYSLVEDDCKKGITELFTNVSLCKPNAQITVTANRIQ